MDSPEQIDAEELLINLAVESWRLSRMFQRSIDTRDIKAAGTSGHNYYVRQDAQIDYSQAAALVGRLIR